MVAVTSRSTTHDEDDGAPAAHHEPSEAAASRHRPIGRGRRRATAGRSPCVAATAYRTPATALTASAPDEPKTACWRSASTITCEVISQPPAHSSGRGRRPTGPGRPTRIGTDSAWASPTPAPLMAPMATRLAVSVSIADGAGADGETGGQADAPSRRSSGADRSASIPPMPTWTAPSTAPPASPPMAAAPTASMLPATARAATPASGNPTKVPSHRAHRLISNAVACHVCLPSEGRCERCCSLHRWCGGVMTRR